MKTVNINFELPDNLEVQSKQEGDNVNIVVKEKWMPKNGDVIYCNYPDGDIEVSWVTLVKKVSRFEKNDTYIDAYALYMICTNDIGIDVPYLKIDSNQSADCSVRLATPSEAQLLFNALAKEGKRWNAETLQIEDIEKDILVPESIKIFRLYPDVYNDSFNGDSLFIEFNEKQLLGYRDGCFVSDIMDKELYQEVQCKLVECKREDLKAGDTAVGAKKTNLHLSYYCKIIDDKLTAYISMTGVNVQSWSIPSFKWFKVVPIK